jgi:hypothetical protein
MRFFVHIALDRDRSPVRISREAIMFLKQAKRPYFILYSLPLALAACSGKSSSGAAPEDAGVSDAGASALSFNVVEAESKTTPISGALAYAEYMDGKNESAQSDATGKVTFTSASIASGVESVSFGAAARTVHSFVEPNVASLTGAPITLEVTALPPTFVLSGALKPVTAGDSVLMQSSISPSADFLKDNVTASSTYSFTLPSNILFTVYGSEYLMTTGALTRGFSTTITKWFHVDHPGLTSNTTFDLDLTALPSDTSMTASGTLEIPGGDSGPLGGASTAFVIVLGQNGQSATGLPNIGFTTSIQVSSDNSSFLYSLEYVPYPNLTPSTYGQITQVDGSFSYVEVPGFPTAGQKLTGLPYPIALPGPLSEGSAIDATTTNDSQTVVLAVDVTGNTNSPVDLWDVALPSGKISKVPVLSPAIKALLPSGASFGAQVQVQSVKVGASFSGSRFVAITP